MPRLYLIPSSMGEQAPLSLPVYALSLIRPLSVFITENGKAARHYLKTLGMDLPLQQMRFFELNQHTQASEWRSFLAPALEEGLDIGLLSDAGCPGVADPGAVIVQLAHDLGLEVMPLPGASSLLLALMASGLNGQCFAFQGYLPVQPAERKRALQQLEKEAQQKNQTQLFIETPYRNDALIVDALQTLRGDTRLCLAADLTLPSQWIGTKTIKAWKQSPPPSLHKRLCVFALGL